MTPRVIAADHDALETSPIGRRGRWAAAGRLAVRRLLVAVPITVAVSIAVFALAAASPFDPLAGYLGDRYLTVGVEQAAALREQLGLNRPWIYWWWDWFTAGLQGDLDQQEHDAPAENGDFGRHRKRRHDRLLCRGTGRMPALPGLR